MCNQGVKMIVVKMVCYFCLLQVFYWLFILSSEFTLFIVCQCSTYHIGRITPKRSVVCHGMSLLTLTIFQKGILKLKPEHHSPFGFVP
jgi:hypothetical protein